MSPVGPEEIVVITGANGFVGSALVGRLSRSGGRVRALVRDPAKAVALQQLPGVEVRAADVRDPASLRGAFAGCAYVIHTAAAMKGALRERRAVNVDGTRNVAEEAATAGVRRVVHISTIGVYGMADLPTEVTEDMGPRPARDPYTVTKAEGEAVLRSVGAERGLSYCIVRPGNIYGPGSAYWTAAMFKLVKRKAVWFLGDGHATNPLIHIDDLVDLCLACTVAVEAHGKAFNATPDRSPTYRDLLLGYASLVGHQRWVAIPVWPFRIIAWLIALLSRGTSAGKEAKNLLVFMTSANVHYGSEKARRIVGWEPKLGLDAGVRSCAPWLRATGALTRAADSRPGRADST